MIPTIPTPDELLDKGFSRGKKQADLMRTQKIPKHLKGKRIEERRVIWDISVIAYMINRTWFKAEQISCPIIKEDASYELTENRHNITFVNYLNANKIYSDLFEKLVK